MARVSFEQIEDELVQIIMSLRQAQARMTADEFRDYASELEMDEATANDFVAADGSVEGMTDRIWDYFEVPRKPRKDSTA